MLKKLLCAMACLMILCIALTPVCATTNEEADQFSYKIKDGKAFINGRSVEPKTDVVVPGTILGYPVVVSYFSHSDTIRSVKISDGAVAIDEYAFGASSIKEIYIPKSVTTIGQGAFLLCGQLESVVLPDGITTINDRLFSDCSNLTSVNIPSKVTYIGERAFSGCEKLRNVTIPEGVTTIGRGAFVNCEELTSIVIPKSVTTIGDIAFVSCDKLKRIWVDPNNNAYSSDEYDALYNKAKTRLITVPSGFTGEFVIPVSVTIIEQNAFADCVGLSNVVLSDKITVLPEGTFSGCTNLTEIVIPKSVQKIEARAFASSGLKKVYYEGTEAEWKQIDINENAFITELEKLNVEIIYNFSNKDSHDIDSQAKDEKPTMDIVQIGAIFASVSVVGVLATVIIVKSKNK